MGNMTMNIVRIALISLVIVCSPVSVAQNSSGSIEKAYIDNTDNIIELMYIVFKDMNAEEIIKLAQEGVIEELKDPDSANFRNEKVIQNETGMYVCGEVNAKNSYGGYVGFMPYFSTGIGLHHIMTEHEDTMANIIVPYYCLL